MLLLLSRHYSPGWTLDFLIIPTLYSLFCAFFQLITFRSSSRPVSISFLIFSISYFSTFLWNPSLMWPRQPDFETSQILQYHCWIFFLFLYSFTFLSLLYKSFLILSSQNTLWSHHWHSSCFISMEHGWSKECLIKFLDRKVNLNIEPY